MDLKGVPVVGAVSMRKVLQLLILLIAIVGAPSRAADQDLVRIKDLGRLSGWRDNALVGYGLVSGLAGTGDSPRNQATRQSIANLLQQFDIKLGVDQVSSRNVAAVMVTASLPPFARPGDALDVSVTSVGDARSLLGGSLLLAPLKGADGRVYVLAQGPVSVGGYKYDMNGNVVQKNHPTVGVIPAGGSVELAVVMPEQERERPLTFVLVQADYTTAERISEAINRNFGTGTAFPKDAAGVEIVVPKNRKDNLVAFMAAVENISVQPDVRARVVVNERTGVVVSGGDVKLSRVVISHGDLKVTVTTDNSVSQPLTFGVVPGARTEFVANSRIDVTEGTSNVISAQKGTVADLVQALAKVKTPTRDVIAVLQAIKAAGALRAELVIQ